MTEFGRCSDPTCTEIAVRLFDCVHHCMKMVCLQHLIEHDRLIEHNQQQLDNVHIELKQLWTTYSFLVNETKLQFEFEQKLDKHQQLIRDITNLLEKDSITNEQYRITLEKLQRVIEQEKKLDQYPIESITLTEYVKTEPINEISTDDELDSLDISLATRLEKLDNYTEQHKRKSMAEDSSTTNDNDQQTNNSNESSDNESTISHTNDSLPIRNLSGECPFWFDGAFGLTQKVHAMYLCLHKKYRRGLYQHLIKCHKLTISSAEIICQAIKNNQNPFTDILFQSNDIVIDHKTHFQCPFSVYNNASSIIDNSSQRPCRSVKPQFGYKLRYHLIHFHQMTMINANKLVDKIKK